MSANLHERLTLYSEGSEKYTFVPAQPNAPSLSVDRDEGTIYLDESRPVSSGRTVFGIVGIISLSITDYIIVITARERKGSLLGQDIYQATDFDILPVGSHASVSAPSHPVEAHLLGLVKSHLKSGYFLFSYTWDITRKIQAQWERHSQDGSKPMWEKADDRFFWNRFLQSRLIDQTMHTRADLSPFILPILYGTFDVQSAVINGHSIHLALLSRRSRFRAGTRYFKRGVDHEGQVANYNETEQIVTVDSPRGGDASAQLSYVQIRGSIPVFWAEINNLRYMPDLQIMDLEDTADAMRMHLDEQVNRYGPMALVNLINHKGHEKPIKEAYEKYMKTVDHPNARYQYFDFHAECSRMRWDRISLLLDDMQKDLVDQGYFHLDSNKDKPVQVQKGVIRTNCMDNLDRTNVTQAAFARWNLDRQLKVLGILPEGGSIAQHEALDRSFRILWSDHANLISTAYSGTPALKTDFTRTGKRTKKGAFEDFTKSAMRYIKNNYFDGPRQDAFDLFTGAYIPRRGPSSMLALVTDNRPLLVRAMPYIAWYSLFMILAGLTLPRTSTYSLFLYHLIWLVVLAGAVAFIFLHGTDYVSWPKLIPPTDVLLYTGPGFRARMKGPSIGIPVLDEKSAKWMVQGRRRAESKAEQLEMGNLRKRSD